MEPVRYWAAVAFTAQNGCPEALLSQAAADGLHLFAVSALPGGFSGCCAARHYRRLAGRARHLHVRLRVRRRLGLYFRLRPLLHRSGLWAGLCLFVPLLLCMLPPSPGGSRHGQQPFCGKPDWHPAPS